MMSKPNKKTPYECQCEQCRKTPESAEAQEHRAINRVIGLLNEKSRRQFVGLLALEWGRGSVERLSIITGLSRPTIRRGREEVQKEEQPSGEERIRARGAGRKLVEKNDLG